MPGRLFLLLGDPLEHSISPELHNAALVQAGLDAQYAAQRAATAEQALELLQQPEVAGASVTIPLKVALLPHAHELDRPSRLCGALNTLVKREGRLLGFNTDAAGVRAALQPLAAGLAGATAVVLGAGGAARAVLLALDELGLATAWVLARREAAAQNLARDLADRLALRIESAALDDPAAADLLGRIDLLCNTTPVGMWPAAPAAAVDPGLLRTDAIVFDAVYRPRRTLLLERAAERGCRTLDGATMFLHQAAEQFRLFTGLQPPLPAMAATIERLLGPGLND